MKILHICSASVSSGAGNAAKMTHVEMLSLGINSRILYLVESDVSSNFEFSFTGKNIFRKGYQKIISFLDRSFIYLYPKRENRLFSPGLVGLSLNNNKLIKWADIIHIHWVNHGFVNISEIPIWNKKIIWTLRDMWAFTGGCHHSFDCLKYQNVCTSCIQLGSTYKNDLSYYAFNHKLNFLKKANINWVAISSWMKNSATKSNILKGKEIDIIFSGIRTNEFLLKDKITSREVLGLPISKKIILIGASNFKEKYKGYQYITDCLNLIEDDVLVISFGSDSILESEINKKFINFGFIKSVEKLSLLYNSADIFLSPSIAEAFGKTFAEAQSCGLPVVCFDKTGPADIIEHKTTGYIASYKNTSDLAFGVNFCLNNNMDRIDIRNRAVALFDIKISIDKYLKLYNQ